MRTSRSTLRSALAAVTVAAAMTSGAATAFADQPDDPNGEKNATRCDENDVELDGRMLVWNGDVRVDGFAFSHDDVALDQDGSVTINSVDEDFTVSGVVVKGGSDGYNVYRADDLVRADLPWTLSTPENPSSKPAGISHWFVCGYMDEENNDDNPPTTDTTTSTPTDTETSTPTESETSTTTPGETTTTEGTTSSPSSSQPAAPTQTSTTEAAPAVSSDDTENLAYTGFNNAWLIWLGGALVLAGAAALVLLRVRRSRS